MIEVRDVFSVLIGVLALGVATRADMMSVSPMDIECRQTARLCSEVKVPPADSASFFEYQGVVNLALDLGGGGLPSLCLGPVRISSKHLRHNVRTS